MISNYFKIIFRTLLHNKLGYFLNISGLAMGFAAFIFIFYYVNHEMQYDTFHEKKDQIYRVAYAKFKNGELVGESAENYPGIGPAMVDNFPEVLAYTRLYNAGGKNNVVFSRPESTDREGYKVNRFLYADSSFFKIFSFPLVKGDQDQCLVRANTAVISESFARKVFKNENPIGKLLKMSDDDFNDETCTITGVFKDVPFDSHLKFDVLFAYPNLINRFADHPGFSLKRYHLSWDRKDMYTYVLLREGSDPKAVAQKFPALIDQFKPDLVMLNEQNEFSLQPLTKIHLDSNLADEAEHNGQRQQVYSLILAAILILLIAMVNFLNYSIARSITRAKGYGIRKVFGAINRDLFFQFIIESLFLNGLAIALAIGIVV
ncbi:MAG: ABC transporter permease, partial [Bacteroidota bacterium]